VCSRVDARKNVQQGGKEGDRGGGREGRVLGTGKKFGGVGGTCF
jgi:hypothetical protein